MGVEWSEMTFKAGQSGNPSGKRKDRRELPDGLTAAQRARKVLESPKVDDQNSAQRSLRRRYEKDYEGYIKLVTALERAERQAGPVLASGVLGGAGPAGSVGEGEARVLALCERILRRVSGPHPG